MLLSEQTIKGLTMTSLAMAECVQVLLREGADFVLTSHFNQDPLEQHFGHLRHKGGANNNPTVVEACNSMGTVRTVNCLGLASKKGNTKVCSKPSFSNSPVKRKGAFK